MEDKEFLELAKEEMKKHREMYGVDVLTEVNTNPHYDWRTSRNGGGYYQPLIQGVVELNGVEYFIRLKDTSCGDFGDRVSTFATDGVNVYRRYYNTMNGDGLEYNDFPEGLNEKFREIRRKGTRTIEGE